MTYAVKFQDAYFCDRNLPITLEESLRLSGYYAGVHDYDIEDAINETFEDLGDWTEDAEGTFAISSDRLLITGAGAARAYRIWHDTEVPPSFVASFDLVSGAGQFLFLGERLSGRGFMVFWNPVNCGFAILHSDGTPSFLTSVPLGFAGPARLQVVVKYSLDSINEDVRWMQAALFVDGQYTTGVTKDIGGTTYDWTGSRLGFSAMYSNTLIVDNFTVSAFARIVEWSSIDIGDTPASGQGRAIGTTRMARIARYDGTARMWRPGDRDEDWAIPDERPVQLMDRDNRTEVGTHVRVRGVWYECDYHADDEIEVHMHRFSLHDDPNIIGKQETWEMAQRVLHDRMEEQFTVQIVIPPNPLLEPHDRISYGGDDYRVMTLNRELVVAGQGVHPKGVVQARQYLPLTVEDEQVHILAEEGAFITSEAGEVIIPE